MAFRVLYGEEGFLVQERVSELKSGMASFEGLSLDGKVDLQEIIDFLSNVSMFSPGKFVVMKSPPFLGAEGDDSLLKRLDVLKSIVSDRAQVVVVSEKPLDMRRKVSGWLKKNTVLEEFAGFKDWEQDKLRAWLKARFLKVGLSCDADGLELLLDFGGTSLRFLSGEVAKLSVYLGDRKTVTGADIEVVCQRGSVSIFAFQEAVRGRTKQSVAMLKRLLDDGEEPVMLVGMIVNQLRLFYQLLEMSKRRVSGDDIAKQVGKNPFYIKKLIPQISAAYSLGDLGKAIRYFAEADISIKTGKMRPRNAVEVAWVKVVLR